MLLDGVDVRRLSSTTLRDAVVMVTQENYLFSGTVADNIRFGRPDATMAEVEAAARAIGAHEFISALPHGYDTDVANRGGRLSAGQRQLVAFARAFLADPAVLILDEATSSLDVPSERLVQHALRTVLAGRTAVIIAHRLSTVEIADRVLVMEHGRIVEDGTPADLVAGGDGRFADLHQAWLDSLAWTHGRTAARRASRSRSRSVTDLSRAGVAETARLIADRDLTARVVVEEALGRIAAADPGLNAFSRVLADEARAEAAARDEQLAAGAAPGPLHGVPVAIKEEIDVAGTVTTFGGEANSTPVSADAEIVRRLRDAGAVVIGKTTMPEFGAFPYTESASRGITRNPWDRTRTPGGSSGGTAAAVASGMVPVGIGGDGGGSIRIPSACCGLFGLKPQRGRVTTAPQPHLWWALGTAGPLARSVLDSAIVYDVIRGNVDTDLYRAGEAPSFAEAARRAPGRLRIGWTTKPVTLGVKPDPAHVQAVADTVRLLADLGHDVREVDPGYPDPTAAFVPQFFAGHPVRGRHRGALRAPGAAYPRDLPAGRLGAPARDRLGAEADREGVGEGEPGLRLRGRPAHPDDRAPAAARRPARRRRHGARLAAGDAGDRLRRVVERGRQPGRGGPVRHRRRRAPALRPAGRAHRRRGDAVLARGAARAGAPLAAARGGVSLSQAQPVCLFGPITANCTPAGSRSSASRPYGESSTGWTSVPPAATACSTVASVSATWR